MNINEIKYIYFVGIGGIGMSALARYFKNLGKTVAGFDRTNTVLTERLIDEGIDIHFEDKVHDIPSVFKDWRSRYETIVIYTPAIPADHSEMKYFRQNEYSLYKRAEVLGLISQNGKTIAVSGTHGKTTITTLTAHIFQVAGMNSHAFLGGISKNYGSNFLIPENINDAELNKKEKYYVVEADEYDRSFLQLHPYIGIVTAVDADHLDIYQDKQHVEEAFIQFIAQINEEGSLVIKKDVNLNLTTRPKNIYSYSLNNNKADFYSKNLKIRDGLYSFDFVTPTKVMEDISLGTPGKLNVENTIAAAAVACLVGVSEEVLRQALESFTGVERRFDFQIQHENLIYIDDYAHHPEELKAFIQSVREFLPGKKISGIFQPHLFTRTRDFADEFAASLEYLDELILLEIYPAREEPIEGVTSQIIFDKVDLNEKYMVGKDKLIDFIKDKKFEVILTIGAGDIDKVVRPLKETLEAMGIKDTKE